jgi:hypothetical protein
MFGISGGELIFHPYRWSKSQKKWRWGPHFHLMAFGYLDNVPRIHRATGWVIKDLGDRRSRKDIYGTVRYELDHLGISQQVQGRGIVSSITWFGTCAYNKLKVPKRDTRLHCPECGCELVSIVWFGEGLHPCEGLGEGEYWLDPPGWDYFDTTHGLGDLM